MNLNHYQKLKQELHNTSLCIVSKRRTEEEILFYYQQGERIFGENRSEELILKANHLPKDIQWHYIGHLQRNKVRKLLPYLNTLESLDSLALADVLEKECQRIDKDLNVYLELHLAEEDEHITGLLKNELN
ncbi:MAG: YggS family pyridoxal phosphate-dependent enzyme, partial [Solobacterium sp.]|nr:YggS family pyridoxal phosphate-dependent enzyme [Solobacterium sp.]